MWTKIKGYIRYSAKAVYAVAVPLLWEAVIEIITALQGTFVDNPLVSAALGAIAVWFARNGPKPV